MPGIPPDSDGLAEKLARLHLRLFPRPFSNHATECIGIVGEEPAYVASKVCQLQWTDLRMRDKHSYPARVSRVVFDV